MKIGVVGYSAGKFDPSKATKLLDKGLTKLESGMNEPCEMLVSGWTDMGIPALAYRIARKKGWKTKGIACGKASEYTCFPCDEVDVVGKEWGDESDTFLNDIDAMLRVGGGKQSLEEVEKFKQRDDFEPHKLVEFELERED
jgi:hypothetical protein